LHIAIKRNIQKSIKIGGLKRQAAPSKYTTCLFNLPCRLRYGWYGWWTSRQAPPTSGTLPPVLSLAGRGLVPMRC